MEILLNELSIHGQFESFEDFQSTALIEMLCFFNLQKDGVTTLLKKSDIYSKQVYRNKSLHDILISKDKEGKSDEIRKLKSQLITIITDPFWDSHKQCSDQHKYLYLKQDVSNSCLAEAYERDCPIISLKPSNFLADRLDVFKDNNGKSLLNYYSYLSLVQKLYNDRFIEFEFYCKTFFKGTKLDFSLVNRNKSFEFISNKNDEDEFLNSFIMFRDMNWYDILQQGGKGENVAGLAYRKYENQEIFDTYKVQSTIYKFRTTQKYRVFGFRSGDTFFVLEFDLTHRLSD
ncbi:hypothetical protein [Sphingobacterium siyangense]|uniref:hypothetical protein n=1 Tax=Sphingobacterium siyangense TaxID=459529 RepID=UPI0028A9E02C|nr:hypothetical protein [Sphingobacterium siyangense]